MKEKEIFIFGSTGQLGGELIEARATRSQWKVRPWSHEEIDVTDSVALKNAIGVSRPWAVVNCTAYNQVDAAQNEPEKAFAVNAAAVASLAGICRCLNIYLVHFGTDFVFDGKSSRPYREEDPAIPLNIYGLSKLAGEQALRILHPRHCIIRTCGLYGPHRSRNSKRNFVDAILSQAQQNTPIQVRNDLILSPTYAPELAEATCQLMEREALGTFHAANTGQCSWHEFAREILRQKNLRREVAPISGPAISNTVPRPPYAVLDISKLNRLGIRSMSSWQDALAAYLAGQEKGSAHGNKQSVS